MMIIDHVSNNKDTIFYSGKHKHKEVRIYRNGHAAVGKLNSLP